VQPQDRGQIEEEGQARQSVCGGLVAGQDQSGHEQTIDSNEEGWDYFFHATYSMAEGTSKDRMLLSRDSILVHHVLQCQCQRIALVKLVNSWCYVSKYLTMALHVCNYDAKRLAPKAIRQARACRDTFSSPPLATATEIL
jgi:hypothetical protein